MTTIMKEDKVFLTYHNFNPDCNLGGATFVFEGTPEGWRVGYALCDVSEPYVRIEGRARAIDRLATCALMPWSEMVEGSDNAMPALEFFQGAEVQELCMVATLKVWPEFAAKYARNVAAAAINLAQKQIRTTIRAQMKAMKQAKYRRVGQEELDV